MATEIKMLMSSDDIKKLTDEEVLEYCKIVFDDVKLNEIKIYRFQLLAYILTNLPHLKDNIQQYINDDEWIVYYSNYLILNIYSMWFNPKTFELYNKLLLTIFLAKSPINNNITDIFFRLYDTEYYDSFREVLSNVNNRDFHHLYIYYIIHKDKNTLIDKRFKPIHLYELGRYILSSEDIYFNNSCGIEHELILLAHAMGYSVPEDELIISKERNYTNIYEKYGNSFL